MGETPRAVPCTRQLIDLDNYKGAVAARLENAWEVAHAQVMMAQKCQKTMYDGQAKTSWRTSVHLYASC